MLAMGSESLQVSKEILVKFLGFSHDELVN